MPGALEITRTQEVKGRQESSPREVHVGHVNEEEEDNKLVHKWDRKWLCWKGCFKDITREDLCERMTFESRMKWEERNHEIFWRNGVLGKDAASAKALRPKEERQHVCGTERPLWLDQSDQEYRGVKKEAEDRSERVFQGHFRSVDWDCIHYLI